MENKLTLEQLKKMEPHKIFIFKPGFAFARSFMFVAKRGEIHDWAIYTSLNAIPMVDFWAGDADGIAKNGLKLKDKNLIKELVPCTDEVFEMYRF